MKYLFLSFVFVVLTSFRARAQLAIADSLLLVLEKAETDTMRVDILHQMGKAYFSKAGNTDSAIAYANRSVQMAADRNYKYREARGKQLLGEIFLDKDPEKSVALFTDAKEKFFELGKTEDQFYLHLYWTFALEEMNSIPEAFAQFDSAEKYADLEDPEQYYNFFFNLGNFNWYQKKYNAAIKYYWKNIRHFQMLGDTNWLYYAYADLGGIYYDAGYPDSAIFYLEKALPYISTIDPNWAYGIKGCLGTNYKAIGDCRKAIDYFEQGLEGYYVDKATWESSSFAEMGACYFELGNESKGKYFNELAVQQLNSSKELKLKVDALRQIVSNFIFLGDYQQAFNHLNDQKALEDSIYKMESRIAAEEFEAKYELREKEAWMALQDLELKRQRTLIIYGSVVLLLLAGLIFLAWRNIRHRKRTNLLLAERNQHLETLDRTKSRFFSNISHELRTPLTLVMAPLQQAIEKIRQKEAVDDLELARRNSQKLFVLVDEILDLSKLESGQMELHPVPVQLEEVLRRFFFAFQSLANIRGIKLKFNSALPSETWVKADVPKLEKMVNNLVSNAIKYSGTGGVVALEVRNTKYEVRDEKRGSKTINVTIEITDSGSGISEKDLPKIFDRFYQSDSGQLTGGTGIGLALTKELAQLFGGEIHVDSEMGKGSTFSLHLPLEKINKPPEIQMKEELLVEEDLSKEIVYTPILINGERPRILVVEDNPEMSRFLKQTLSPNYECTFAYDGKEAMQKLERAHFDLVTSDVMMPEMDGFEFLNKVRQQGTTFEDVPFILLTARSLEEDKLEGFQLGVDDYITKPFSTRELIARIDNLLRNKKTRDGRRKTEDEVRNTKEESADRKILKQAERIVMDHISDPGFGVQQLAEALSVSQRSLVRLIKRLTGLSPVGFIREIRLQKAYQLLQRRQFLSVTEVRYEVGIEHASYFNKVFKERFGVSPGEVLGKGA